MPDGTFLDAVVLVSISLISLSWLMLVCLLAKRLPLSAKLFGELGAAYFPAVAFCVFAPADMGRALDIREWRYFEATGGMVLLLFMWTQTAFGAIAVVMLRRKH